MTGKGTISAVPHRRLRFMLGAQLLWIGLACVLGAWWVSLVLSQAARIAELERLAGIASDSTISQWTRTQRMLYWESGAFFLFLIATVAILFWLYWRDATRSKGLQAFFASVTHELRTPLTSIRLQAEALAEGTQKSDLIRRLLEDTQRLESQVERTLELARVEGGGPVFTQSLRLKSWVERLVNSWRETHGNAIEIRMELDDINVEADKAALQVILKNLLENSLRHSRREPVQVTLRSDRHSIRFSDNGEGFKGDASKLGQLFQKGPSSQGAGVGLYLVKVLMERMGGKAEFVADSRSGGLEIVLRFREGNPDA